MSSPNNVSFTRLNNKEPWLAVILSTILAGTGQIYTGDVVKGWLFILSQLLLYSLAFGLVFSSNGDTAIGILLVVVAFSLGILSFFDAYKSAVNRNYPSFEAARRSNKDPWKAVFLSRIIPGIGHIYLGKKFIGILIVTIWLSLFFWQPNIEDIILTVTYI